MTSVRTAAVVGGGIAGHVAAMALRKAGIDATVYEAYDTAADGIGGGLSIAPNGMDALRALDAEGPVTAIGTPINAMVMQSGTGRTLGAFGTPDGLPDQQFVWRGELYRALHDAAAERAVRTEYGKRLVGLDDTGDHVTARFADGTQASADILVGADGIASAVRPLIDPAAPHPRYTGLISFGARMADTGLPGTGGRMHMVFGRRAFFGYQVEADGSGGWFVNLPHRTRPTVAQARERGAGPWLAELAETFAADRVPARELLSRTEPDELLIVGPMDDMPRVPTWSRGRTVLVGDAAHAPSASSGQGASLAMESAVQLARCLRDLPYDQAFHRYERLRRDRTERIIAMGAKTNSNKAAGPIARVLRDLVMPIAMKHSDPTRFTWQFTHHITWADPTDA